MTPGSLNKKTLISNGEIKNGTYTINIGNIFYDEGLHIINGSNGSGKTSLLKSIAGIIPLSRGNRNSQISFGYVPQSYSQILASWATIRQNIEWLNRVTVTEFLALSKSLKLDDEFIDRRPFQLSGGQRQKVTLLRECLLEVDCLVIDEPFSSMDPESIKASCAIISKLKANHPMVILTSHIDLKDSFSSSFAIHKYNLDVTVRNNSQLSKCTE